MAVREVCNTLWELVESQGGGCVDESGVEVFPFDSHVHEGDAVEVLAGTGSARAVRGAVWRLTHAREWKAVWALRTLEGLTVGVLSGVPLETTRG